MVMELVQGRDLGVLIAEEAPLPLARAASLVEAIASALEAAHQVGIAHLDLKPSNILVFEESEREVIKLVDFGISQVVGEDPDSEGRRAVVGSLGYLAPERVRAPEAVDSRSDQFSLAAIAYELITGAPAFPSTGDARADIAAILEGQPHPPTFIKPDLPLGVEKVLATGLNKSPVDRFATSLAFAEALSATARGSPARRWLPRERVRAAGWFAFSLLAAGILDVALRIQALGLLPAFRAAATDPAKTVFHIVQLPLVAGLLALRLPRALLVSAFRWYPRTAISVALLFAVVVTAVTLADMREAVCERLTLPEDVRDTGLRADLLGLRQPGNRIDLSNQDSRRTTYSRRLTRARGPECHYLQMASFRAIYSGFLTWLALLAAAFISFLLFIQLLVAGFRRSASFEVLGACVLLFLPWIVLRVFTEWYANLGSFQFSAYQPFGVALAATALAGVLILLAGGHRRALWRVVVAFFILSGATFLAAVFAPRTFDALAKALGALPAVHLVAVGTAVFSILGALAFTAHHTVRVDAAPWSQPIARTRTQVHPPPHS